MGPLFLFLSTPFLLEYDPRNIYLSILFVGMVPCHARTYVGAQFWSVLILLVRMVSNFFVHVPRTPHATQIVHVTEGRGLGWGKINSRGRLH